MPIDTTIEKGYTTTIFLTFSTTYTQQYIFASFLVFSKSELRFPEKAKEYQAKTFPRFPWSY